MSAVNQPSGGVQNYLKFAVAAAILLSYIWLNQHFSSDWSVALRFAVGVVVFAVSAFLLLKTSQGHRFKDFAKAAYIEMRKVVWPTRKETVHTTWIVAVFVVVVAIFMWLIDMLLVKMLSFITG